MAGAWPGGGVAKGCVHCTRQLAGERAKTRLGEAPGAPGGAGAAAANEGGDTRAQGACLVSTVSWLPAWECRSGAAAWIQTQQGKCVIQWGAGLWGWQPLGELWGVGGEDHWGQDARWFLCLCSGGAGRAVAMRLQRLPAAQ
jgi:hypothetical protein